MAEPIKSNAKAGAGAPAPAPAPAGQPADGAPPELVREVEQLRERVKSFEEKDRKRGKLLQTLAAQILTPPGDNDKGNKRNGDIRATLAALVDVFAPPE